jgi:hypothetical protein
MSRHKGRTACAAQKAISVLPPIADMKAAGAFVPDFAVACVVAHCLVRDFRRPSLQEAAERKYDIRECQKN